LEFDAYNHGNKPQSSAKAGMRTESLGKLKEEQLKVGPKGVQHRGRCKSKSNRSLARRVREWDRPNQIARMGATHSTRYQLLAARYSIGDPCPRLSTLASRPSTNRGEKSC